MQNHNFFVYITTNPAKTTFYTGVTNDLFRRMQEHYKNRSNKNSFEGKYYCYQLVYFERYDSINMAIEKEKEIKDLSREKKIALIKSTNPGINFIKISN